MPSRHSGHFVQIWRPVFAGSRYDMPDFVEVAGRTVERTISQYRYDTAEGWTGVSRELPLREARRFARAYSQAGFPARVLFLGNGGEHKIVLALKGHRRKK